MTLQKTFLYAVRDAHTLHVKFGYTTESNLPAAAKHLVSRYGTSYLHCELLQVVPVPMRGQDAERQVKARLAAYYVKREFLLFTDELTLKQELETTYAELSCPVQVAYQVERTGRECPQDCLRRRCAVKAARDTAIKANIAAAQCRQRAAHVRKLRAADNFARIAALGSLQNNARPKLIQGLKYHPECCSLRKEL